MLSKCEAKIKNSKNNRKQKSTIMNKFLSLLKKSAVTLAVALTAIAGAWAQSSSKYYLSSRHNHTSNITLTGNVVYYVASGTATNYDYNLDAEIILDSITLTINHRKNENN